MVLRTVKKIADAGVFLKDTFPLISHWLRMPGLLSWAGVALGTVLAFHVPFHACAAFGRSSLLLHWLVLPAMALLAGAGIFLRPAFFRFLCFFLFAIPLCLLHRAHQTDVFSFLRETMNAPVPVSFAGKVTSAPLPCYENFHFLLKIDSVADHASKPLRGVTVNCICPAEPLLYGRVVARGVFSPPRPRRNPFEYDEFTAMMAQGIWGTFTAGPCSVASASRSLFERLSAAFRDVTIAALRKIIDFDNRALLQASFLGDTEFLSPFIKDIFRKSGIYHLIAISGLNTAMLAAALYFFLRLFSIGKTARHLICIAALWAYLPFVGFIPSLFRATIMATCVIAATLFEKKNYALHTLGLAGTFWFIVSPESLFEPGYQLSFAATAGILTLFPVLNQFTPKPGNRFLRSIVVFLFSSFYISLASFLTTAPILLYHFGTVSYFGLLANLVAVGTMTISMWAFFAGLFFQMVLPFLAAVPLWVSERFMDIVVGTGKIAGLFSWSRVAYPVPAPEIILFFSLFLIGFVAVCRERMKAYLIVSIVAAAVFAPADFLVRHSLRHLEVVRFAIPKTAVVGIKWPDNRLWLVTANPSRSLPWLIEQHVAPWARHTAGNRFDALFVPEYFCIDSVASLPEFAAARILTFPVIGRYCAHPPLSEEAVNPHDSLLSLYTPCCGCTCAITRHAPGIGVRIVATGFDTTLFLYASSRRRTGDLENPGADEETRSALVMTTCGKEIRSCSIVPPDHPVR
ncbi:MAG: ComEC/Rec2 family competence protein [Chitinispirillaceae bacterium]|jgi:ComEC/Rec2-related protein